MLGSCHAGNVSPEFILKEITMKKPLAALLATTALCYGSMAQAQTTPAPDTATTPVEQNSPPAQMTLDDRFTQCVSNTECPVQTRMQIIQEESDDMTMHFQKIQQACANMDFKECINPQKDDVQKWYTANNRMRQMMQTMSAESLEKKEPGAGDKTPAKPAVKKSLWDRIWNFGTNK
jgi:hypothetical protein